MDMDIDTPRRGLALSSVNSSRVSSAYSNISSVSYHERMEIQNNKLTCDEIAISEKENFSLSYATPKVGEKETANKVIDHNPRNRECHVNNKVSTLNNMCNPQGEGTDFNNPNTSMLRGIETSSIPYEDNSFVESNT